MAAERNRKHILVTESKKAEHYTPHKGGGLEKPPPPPSRPAHAAALMASISRAEADGRQRREAAGVVVHGAKPGLYIEFESQPGIELNTTSLESKRKGIELVAATEEWTDDPEPKRIQRAAVFVPEGELKYFVGRLQKYELETPKRMGEHRHEDMFDRIAQLRLATLRCLWTDSGEVFPAQDEAIWWEVWLRRHDGRELERLLEFVAIEELHIGDRRLEFPDRIVTLVLATAERLSKSIDVLNDVAEVRRAKELASVFVGMRAEEQAEWVDELLHRSSPAGDGAPAVCVLDTGVNRGHPLLEPFIDSQDVHSVDPSWGLADDGGGPAFEGHGTGMAGLALWGDLTPVLVSTMRFDFSHRLESVKILPPKGQTAPELYGAVTAEAVNQPEEKAPDRWRCFSMAVTAPDGRDRGNPTSWSAAVDALAAGRTFEGSSKGLRYVDQEGADRRRLFVVSAGNIRVLEVDHLVRSDVEEVHDPAQAWNALTVGAFTEKTDITDPSLKGWRAVAAQGELSPYSTTSVPFGSSWPLKPDVVFEGGNAARDDYGNVDGPIDDLSLLTTWHKPTEKAFVISWATSAACAQVARLAGKIAAEYPRFWPETVRALIVHSARWTRAMERRLGGAGGKRARQQLVRRYGFGVPNLDRALRSADDALTLVVQDQIRPFAKGKMNEMHLHDLPWPKGELEQLGSSPVQLRITLSYFVEPNPGRRGWKKRHRYASHGLRFEVKQATESIDEFRKRLNRKALEEDEAKPSSDKDASSWYLGDETRKKGSIHSDIWVGSAADLAERGVIGIYPVGGWWKEQPARDRSASGARYSLVVSIETAASDVDLWTPVALEVGVPIEAVALGW